MKELCVERLWDNTFILRHLVKAGFNNTLTNGALSRTLSMTLTPTLIARAGDVVRSSWYERFEPL